MTLKKESIIRFLFFSLFYSLFSLTGLAHTVEGAEKLIPQSDSTVAPHKNGPESLFARNISRDYEFSLLSFKGSALEHIPLQVSNIGLLRMVRRRFKSRKAVNESKGFFLRFDISSYQFSTSIKATEAFKHYQEEIEGTAQEMQSKAPMLALLRENMVFILNGSCQFSTKNLKKIEAKFTKIVFQDMHSPDSHVLKRHCGGSLE